MPPDRPADLVLAGARLLARGQQLTDGWVAVTDARITALGQGTPILDTTELVDCAGDWLAPGFVDVHVHGGGGGEFMSPDPASRRRVRELHAGHGTTSMLASTVSTDAATLLDAVRRLADDIDETDDSDSGGAAQQTAAARLLGIHLEGPFLSGRRRGAHDEAQLRAPDPDELARLVSAGRGHVRSITLAPELPGGLDLVRRARGLGLIVSLGHTDTDAETMRAAVELGATSVTHTFNGMRPLHHRTPGGVGVAMDDDRLVCELIVDGIHVDPLAARVLVRAAGSHRVCLITDAMTAARMPDGTYELGGSIVDVTANRVVVSGTDILAGSTLTMADAVANAVSLLGLDVATAVAMATSVPARLLGTDEVGTLAPGLRADLVRLRADGSLHTTYAEGRPVPVPDPHAAPESVP